MRCTKLPKNSCCSLHSFWVNPHDVSTTNTTSKSSFNAHEENVGVLVGAVLGEYVGLADGAEVGEFVGFLVGESVGLDVGDCVGFLVGALLGE